MFRRKEMKLYLYDIQDKFCYYCGIEMELPKSGQKELLNYHATIDHRVPVSRGGTNRRENIVASCFECNNTKGSMTHNEFFDKLLER